MTELTPQAAYVGQQSVMTPPPAPDPTVYSPPSQKPGDLPMIYTAAAQARVNGYSWDEINDRLYNARSAAKDAGYTDAEVDKVFGLSPDHAKAPPPPGMERLNLHPDTADAIRHFANTYLTPDRGEPPPVESAGDFAKMLGWSIVDFGKILGAPVANGVAAIMEGLDGKPRTKQEQVQLGVEAQGFLGLLAGDLPRWGGSVGTPPAKGVAALRETIPPVQDFVDAAAAVAKEHHEGITPGTLTAAARTLGDNYVQNGEHPVMAAQRAANDPAVLADLHRQMELPLETPAPPVAADHLLDVQQAAAAGEEAVKHPGWIPPVQDRPALEPIPANDALLNSGRGDTMSALGVGGLRMPRLPELDINPETIGQPSPRLAEGLATDFRRIFDVQSLSPEGAGVIRHGLANGQANMIRSVENLRRFGRAINDLPSDARRAWWHAYEVGDLKPYDGTALGSLGEQLRKEFDRSYARMEKLGIAPNYIENYLPRLYQNPEGATHVFVGKRPLEGSKTFTRERVYEYLQDAEAAGQKLVTDNPAEAALIRLNDMQRYITAHEIMNELEARGLGQWIKFGDSVPAGLIQINDKIARRQGGMFYAPEGVATMLNRHLSPGWSGRPIYDVLRSATSMFTSMKLMLSAFHPLYLAWSSQAEAFGLGLKQMARGGVDNIVGGAARVLKSPIAPLEDIWQGQKLVDFAKTGTNPDPRIATMYDAMLASGARFGRSEVYQSSAAGSFFNNIKGSLAPETGLTTMGQELAAMLRNAPPILIGNTKVAPGFIRAAAQVVPRVIDTLSDPIMGKLVPAMKAGALARMLQEEMAAHPYMTLEDMRRVGGRFSDIIDNRIGEVVQDNVFWPTTLHNLNNVVFMAPQWFMGKLRLFTGAAADLAHFGTVEGPGGKKELSDNLTYLIGGIAAAIYAGGIYGYLKGTWKPDWALKDYLAPPTGGQDRQGGDERVMLPNLWRDAYGWSTDPAHELRNKTNSMWSTLGELATNTQFNGGAITDPAADWREAGGDYAKFLVKQLTPMMWSQDIAPDQNISRLEQFLGVREAPFGIREPELEKAYEMRDERSKVRKKARSDARMSQ